MSDSEKEKQALMLLLLGGKADVRFHKNGVTVAPPLAFQSQALVRDLLKVGFFSMNVHSMARMAHLHGDLPASMLGMAFHYALEAAPRMDPELGADVVRISDLERQVNEIEAMQGPIDIDLDFVARVALLAADPGRQADFAPRDGGVLA